MPPSTSRRSEEYKIRIQTIPCYQNPKTYHSSVKMFITPLRQVLASAAISVIHVSILFVC
jgi:hypothetical protein